MHTKLLATTFLLFACASPSLGIADVPASCDESWERCADNRVVKGVVDLLGPAERTFATVGSRHYTRAVSVAAYELIWQRVRAAKTGTSLEVRAAAAEGLVDAYLAGGLSKEAIGLYETLD